MFYKNACYVWLGNIPSPLLSIVKPEPVDEVLIEATVRNIRVNGPTVKVCRRFGIFIQALCEVVAPLLPDCITEMDMVSHWGTFPLPNLVKQKACKSPLKQY